MALYDQPFISIDSSDIEFNTVVKSRDGNPSIKDFFEIESDAIINFKEVYDHDFFLSFNVKFKTNDLLEATPEEELSIQDFAILVQYVSFESRQRGVLQLEKAIILDNSEKDYLEFSGVLDIDPGSWSGLVSLKPMIVRDKPIDYKENYLSDKGSIMGIGKTVQIYLSPRNISAGGELSVMFETFEEDDQSLYKLSEGTPRVLINDSDEKLRSVLGSKTKTGYEANLRDALFSPIASDIWEQLIRRAFDKMIVNIMDSDGEANVIALDESYAPYNRVAQEFANAKFNSDDEENLESLKNALTDYKTRINLINKDLPIIVQTIHKKNMLKTYSQVSKDLFVPNRRMSND